MVNKAQYQFTPRPVQLSNIRPNLSTASNTIKTGRVNVNSGTQIKSGGFRFNTAKRNVNSGSVHVNSGTQIKSGLLDLILASNIPKKCFSKQRSLVNRPFSRTTAYKSNKYAVKGKMGTAVKTSAGWVWRKTIPFSNTNGGPTLDSNVHDHPLKHMEHRGIFDSGCSGHMTGNRAHLEDYQELTKVGSVTFGGSKGSISGKGTIRLGNLVFDDVAFVKELGHFNLFSISQICDKKLNVLFTEMECFVVVLMTSRCLENQTEEAADLMVVLPDDIMTFRNELDGSCFEALRTSTCSSTTSTNPVNTGSDNLNTGLTEVTPGNIEAISPSADHEEEMRKVSEALEDESWVEAMQEELLQFKLQQVWVLVDLPNGAKVIDEEVYVSQPPGFVDTDHPTKVIGGQDCIRLHQAPRAWYATLSTFLEQHGYKRGTIDKTLFIRRNKRIHFGFKCSLCLFTVFSVTPKDFSSQYCQEDRQVFKGQPNWALWVFAEAEIVDFLRGSNLSGRRPEANGRKSQDDPQDSSVQGLVTPPTTKVNTSGEEQVEEISPNTLEEAKTLSRLGSLKTKVNTAGEINTAGEVNTAGEEVNTVSEINTGSIKLNTGIEQASTVGEDKGQREGKAPMLKRGGKKIHLDALPGKRIAEEEELTEQQKKRKAQVQFEAQHYTNEDWDLIRAKLEANAELSKSMLGSELQGEDFAKRMVDLVNQRKKFFAEERAKAKRNKPMTQSQLKTYMMNYLKNQGTWKLTQLKKLSFEEVKKEFDKLVKQVESFAPISFEATKDSLKRFGEELQTKTPKRLKEDKDDEAKDDEPTKKSGKRRKQMARKGMHTSVDKNDSEIHAMKTPSVATYKIIKQGEKGVYQIVREDGTDIVYINFGAMMKSISRDDLTELYRIVMNRYGMDGPEDKLEKGFWKCLRIMFEEPLSTDSIWSEIGQQKIVSWRYYDTCRVHCLNLESMDIYMLSDRKYPLSAELICYYFYFPPENKVIVARSERTTRAPNSLCLNLEVEDDVVGDLGEPANYKAAMLDPDKVIWQGAMDEEMNSMKVNEVWTEVDPPPNAKIVRSKWLFKKKTDMDGQVHTYKARLVAKGHTQTYEIDYEETFSCVADIRAIRILIAIAAYYDYKIWQMDVKTAFLNGRLDGDIYMEQPEGYVNPRYPNRLDATRPVWALATKLGHRYQTESSEAPHGAIKKKRSLRRVMSLSSMRSSRLEEQEADNDCDVCNNEAEDIGCFKKPAMSRLD
ncbi:retrotransposon protein, putative, ty1-copia subclass [Tanacetum coccineum]|uniref:Retrotransposon protein, putative, ty1-copia subclass n=1 Tax=Tanacetum coccineum TaxID=301880 RepID=A0ABQ5DU22_9ASTR